VLEDLFTKPILIFGCGNPLLGDDGFGPEVVDHLNRMGRLPRGAAAIDVGTSIGDILFDFLLSPRKPRHLFIIDAVCQPGRRPGELFEVAIEDVPSNKSGDFSLHQFPSVNLLRELRESGSMQIRILVVQVNEIPQVVQPGLSEKVREAIPKACEWVLEAVAPLVV
jgi:coenzyme F420 hydrogenase subunit delta